MQKLHLGNNEFLSCGQALLKSQKHNQPEDTYLQSDKICHIVVPTFLKICWYSRSTDRCRPFSFFLQYHVFHGSFFPLKHHKYVWPHHTILSALSKWQQRWAGCPISTHLSYLPYPSLLFLQCFFFNPFGTHRTLSFFSCSVFCC